MNNSKFIWPEKTESISSLINSLLEKRGIDDIDSFLNPKLEDIPSYKELFNSTKAAKKILKYAKEGKKIVIHGDYDADGICATSILWECLYNELGLKVDVIPYIPDRVDQGYGLTASSLDDILKLNCDLLITVDCGVRDKELIKQYLKKGLDFVITDHHMPPADILEDLDYILVHQKYPKHEYAKEEVCGAMVSYLLCQAIRAELKNEQNSNGLDLVALATVTDIMPLVGVNRVVVKYGLEQLRKGKRAGIKAICKHAKIDIDTLDTYHLGFMLGPRINASGRIGSPLDGVRLLVGKKVDELAYKLENLNYERQLLTIETMEEAKSLVETDEKALLILGDNWHEGIVGLVAGKLNEQYHKPTLVCSRNEEGEIRGSARSIKGFNITNALEKCKKYLDRYGGHEQAAGFSLKKDNWGDFNKAFKKIVDKEITEEMLIKEINIDLYINSDDVSIELVNKLSLLEPFGYGNSKPLIGLKELLVVKKQYMGKTQDHIKLLCKGDGVDYITTLIFRCNDRDREIEDGSTIDVVGHANLNTWNGDTQVQFIVSNWMWYNSNDSAK